jgi:hypothetical protein
LIIIWVNDSELVCCPRALPWDPLGDGVRCDVVAEDAAGDLGELTVITHSTLSVCLSLIR